MMYRVDRTMAGLLATLLTTGIVLIACGGGKAVGFTQNADGGPGEGDAAALQDSGDPGLVLTGDADNTPTGPDRDPTTCAEAAAAKSYVGCDYWPTVVPNLVDEVFDFAAVVSNVGTTPAKVTVKGPANFSEEITVEPGKLAKVYLPWVDTLKAPTGQLLTASIVAKAGAYHLTSDRPVIVYQFNALEYAAKGGPPGKDWSSCTVQPGASECYSYSNDASLLLPSTAMTGNYRVLGQHGFTREASFLPPSPEVNDAPYFAVTATADATQVTVKLNSTGRIVASRSGPSIAATQGGETVTVSLDAGDVALFAGAPGDKADLSGALVTATKPVQVIAGVPCVDHPRGTQACDHIEETVFPAETLGKHYVVTVPTGPKKPIVGHLVRFYGNEDDTKLTYKPSKPPKCPDSLKAGEVSECGEVAFDFEVEGDKAFAVGSFMLGGQKLDPPGGLSLKFPLGDPSMSLMVAVEQYRKSYLFLAPDDYVVSFVDIVAPPTAKIKVDGNELTEPIVAVSGGFGVARVKLGAGASGAHTLTSDVPVGIQVMGYGENTSYQYPGGLNLGQITPPPVR
jgi:hypothetical protein